MHIPDGFLHASVWAPMLAISAVILAIAVSKTKNRLGEKHVPLMGVTAAFIFAAQMLNTPISGGTSGHMLGGVFAAVMLGPWSASVVMTVVFIVQALFFGDGGLTALGANTFNMGFLGTIVGYHIYRMLKGALGVVSAAGVAGWLAMVLASIATSLELAASGTIPLAVVLPAMVVVHAVIGIIEAAATMVAVKFISKTRPDLMELAKV